MPIYEFKCDKCGKQFEVVTLSLSEKPKTVCPKCKSKKASKLISRVGKQKYSWSRPSGSSSAGSASSGCSSCSSSNCSSCGH